MAVFQGISGVCLALLRTSKTREPRRWAGLRPAACLLANKIYDLAKAKIMIFSSPAWGKQGVSSAGTFMMAVAVSLP